MLGHPAKNAYEQRDYYGKLTMRERIVGPMVPRCVVAILLVLAGIITGKSLAAPATFWHLFSP